MLFRSTSSNTKPVVNEIQHFCILSTKFHNKNMKALIASGGRGTRLRPLTHTQNKHLIPIANKPILHYAIEHVVDAGIKEIGIVVNADDIEVQKTIGNGDKWNVKITFIPQIVPGGLSQVVQLAEKFIGKDNFIFYLGDNMVVGGVKRFIDAFEKSKCDCFLTLAKVKDPERFGVPEIKNERIISVEEKDRKSTRLNSSHVSESRMPSSA